MGNKSSYEKYEKECSKLATNVERKILKRDFKYKSQGRKYVSSLAGEVSKKYPNIDKQEAYELILYKISYVTWDKLISNDLCR